MNTSIEKRHRFPGSRPFLQADADLFFGRKKESRDLTNLVMVEKLVVLFSPSGAGKTSLLNAGAEPVLLENGFLPIHFRLNCPQRTPEAIFETTFRDFAATWNESFDINQALGGSFWELVKSSPFEKEGKKWVPVFILDQFEEFFNSWPHAADRAVFIKKLAELLNDRTPESLHEHLKSGLEAGAFDSEQLSELENPPAFRILISMRNDMLHLLDELTQAIPAILRSRFQLFPLRLPDAREAILRPASRPGEFASEEFSFSPVALEEILAALRNGEEVEAYRLQLFCAEMEDRLLAQNSEPGFLITPDFYGGPRGIHQIFEEFYEKQLARLPKDKTFLARRVLEMELLTPTGKRQSVEEAEIMSETGVSHNLLEDLEDLRLIRSETRLDSTYYEITHDALVKPIWAARMAQEEADRWAERQREEAEIRKEQAREAKLLESDRKKKWAYAFVLLAASVLCIVWTLYRDAKKQEALATENWNKMRKAEEEKARSEADLKLAHALLFQQKGEPEMADHFLKKAIDADSSRQQSFRQSLDSMRNLARKTD